MATRKKSFSDILAQAERIENHPRATKERVDRANIAADRYTDNIIKHPSFKGRDAYDKKYSQTTYMGVG